MPVKLINGDTVTIRINHKYIPKGTEVKVVGTLYSWMPLPLYMVEYKEYLYILEYGEWELTEETISKLKERMVNA